MGPVAVLVAERGRLSARTNIIKQFFGVEEGVRYSPLPTARTAILGEHILWCFVFSSAARTEQVKRVVLGETCVYVSTSVSAT